MTVVKKITEVLNVWKCQKLCLLGKIIIFKSLAISKIVYISSIIPVPDYILTELSKIHKDFIWDSKRAKIKHSAIINDFDSGGLKYVDIRAKFNSLQLAWVKRYFDNNFHPWKLIPSYLFNKISPHCSIFYPNFSLQDIPFTRFPPFYENLLRLWSNFAYSTPLTASSILSECIWNNCNILIDNKPISPLIFGNSINKPFFIANLFDDSGKITPWESFSNTYNLKRCYHFSWTQILHSLPSEWKKKLLLLIMAPLVFFAISHLILSLLLKFFLLINSPRKRYIPILLKKSVNLQLLRLNGTNCLDCP